MSSDQQSGRQSIVRGVRLHYHRSGSVGVYLRAFLCAVYAWAPEHLNIWKTLLTQLMMPYDERVLVNCLNPCLVPSGLMLPGNMSFFSSNDRLR